MNNREETFRAKFAEAARLLGATPDQIISLKFRENVGSYAEYHELLVGLEQEAGITSSEVQANLQGRGHLCSNGKNKVLVVEHESGLEVLYIVGSVASIVSLVPLVIQGWRAVRGHFPQHRHPGDTCVEIRRVDTTGSLHEQRAHHLVSLSESPVALTVALAAVADLVENEIKHLADRVAKLEQWVAKAQNQFLRGRPRSSRPSSKKAGS
jgi:hypothetical protein